MEYNIENVHTSKFTETKQKLLDTDYDFKQTVILIDELVDYFEKNTVEGTIIKERLEQTDNRMHFYAQFLENNQAGITDRTALEVVFGALIGIRKRNNYLIKIYGVCYDGLKYLKVIIKRLNSLIERTVNEQINTGQYMSNILEEVNELAEFAYSIACNIELFQQNNVEYQSFLSLAHRFDELINDLFGTIIHN